MNRILSCALLSCALLSACASSRPVGSLTGAAMQAPVARAELVMGAALDAAQSRAGSRTATPTRPLEEWARRRFVARDAWSALGAQRELVGRGPISGRLRFNLGVTLEDLGRLTDARAAYAEAAELGELDALLNLIGVCGELGDQACVGTTVEALSARAEASPEDALRHARALHWTGSASAMSAYERLTTLKDAPVMACWAHAGVVQLRVADRDYSGGLDAVVAARDSVLARPPSIILGRGRATRISESDPWAEHDKISSAIEDIEVRSGVSPDGMGCLAEAILAFEAVIVPLQNKEFAFPIKNLVGDLQSRGQAEQSHESALFWVVTVYLKNGSWRPVGVHAAVLIADLYYDFGMALMSMQMPDGLTATQQKGYQEQIEEYAKPLLQKSATAYRKAFDFEEKAGSGHPAFSRAAERLLELQPNHAPVAFQPGSLVRRGERRVTWKMLP